MRCCDWHHASSAEDETMPICLTDCIFRFFLNFSLVLENESILSQASAQRPLEDVLCLRQRWVRLTVMPVNDLKIKQSHQRKENIFAVQMEHVAPQSPCGFKDFLVIRQTECFIFIKFQQTCLRMLHSVKDSVHANFAGRFYKLRRGLCDCVQPFYYSFRIFPKMREQCFIA